VVIIDPRARRFFLRNMLIFGVLAATLFLLYRQREEIPEEQITEEEEEPGEPFDRIEVPTEFQPAGEEMPGPPNWLSLGITLGVATLAAGAILWWLFTRKDEEPLKLDLLAMEAQEALDGMRSGINTRDAVMRCYFEMTRVLQETRAIQRDKGMTPREFEMRLKAAGLPGSYIERLTRLFEGVRYGAHHTGDQQEQEAIACLTAIVDYASQS
jgi:hypothetical protein